MDIVFALITAVAYGLDIYLLLRKVERLSLKIVVATILIVGGVILLSLIK